MITICTGCNRQCNPVEVDFGIGRGEYWGAPYYDTRTEWVSDCCEAPYKILGEDEAVAS